MESSAGLTGAGHENYNCNGAFDMPKETSVKAMGKGDTFIPSGFYSNGKVLELDQTKITEDITYSRLEGYTGGLHPLKGITKPSIKDIDDQEKKSWTKAPRYDGQPAETGPLAEMLIAQNPLFTDLIEKIGSVVFTRQLARLVRPAIMLPVIDFWLKEISESRTGFFNHVDMDKDGEGYGLIEAHRGGLGHWLKISEGKIVKYQIITPTTWNCSPKDQRDVRGPCEEALIGLEVKDTTNPIEVEHVIRSFDPCLVCTVHAVVV